MIGFMSMSETDQLKKWEWKTYSTPIKIACDNLNETLLTHVRERIYQAEKCMAHSPMLFEQRQRKYRRGKNRCHHCGYRL